MTINYGPDLFGTELFGSGFTMDFWIHDGFLDSQWISGFAMDFRIHGGFLDSRWISGFAMDF